MIQKGLHQSESNKAFLQFWVMLTGFVLDQIKRSTPLKLKVDSCLNEVLFVASRLKEGLVLGVTVIINCLTVGMIVVYQNTRIQYQPMPDLTNF